MRVVADACHKWNELMVVIVKEMESNSEFIPSSYVCDMSTEAGLAWGLVEPSVAAGTGTKFGKLCESAPTRVSDLAALSSAMAYLQSGDMGILGKGLRDSVLVSKEGLISAAADSMINKELDLAEGVLLNRTGGSAAAYISHAQTAAAWGAYSKHKFNARLNFHFQSLQRQQAAGIPPAIATAVREAIGAWQR